MPLFDTNGRTCSLAPIGAAGQHSAMISSAGTMGFVRSDCAAIHHLSYTLPPSGFADPNGLIKDKIFVYMYFFLPFLIINNTKDHHAQMALLFNINYIPKATKHHH